MRNLCFGSGPCAKHNEWFLPKADLVGRSHRSKDGLNLIKRVLDLQRKILNIPYNYLVGITPGSTTGAMEMLLWNLISDEGTEILNHCVFSNHWEHDIKKELKAKNVYSIKAPFPTMSDTSIVDFSQDVVFCLSSTTSGVAFKQLNWIRSNRRGLTICDATSAVFTMDIDWSKLDATAFSWQKGIGGEAGSGVIVLSPRAVERIVNVHPDRAIPRLFRIVENGELNYSFFEGSTINTPSMLCIEEYYENLIWAEKKGGLNFLIKQVEKNYNAVETWMKNQNIFRFLVDEKFRATHIICLDIKNDGYQSLSKTDKWMFLHKILEKSENRQYGYDFLGHSQTEPHIRIWGGPTIATEDLIIFLNNLTKLCSEVLLEYDFH